MPILAFLWVLDSLHSHLWFYIKEVVPPPFHIVKTYYTQS